LRARRLRARAAREAFVSNERWLRQRCGFKDTVRCCAGV